jgi:WD40 repeat protein
LDASGRFLAANDPTLEHAVLFDLSTGAEFARTDTHPRLETIALSPDARRIATGTWQGKDIKVWDAATGRLLWTLSTTSSRVAISPDGRWLFDGTWGLTARLWHMDSGRPGPALPEECVNYSAFSRDGKTLAVETKTGAIKLLDPETGRDFATLTPPPEVSSGAVRIAISPSGDRLAVSNGDHQILVWDLRLIREQLRSMGPGPMGLDWDRLPFPPPTPVEPIRSVEVLTTPEKPSR